MNKVKLVVDSTVDLSPELYKEVDADVVPLQVNFGTEVYFDGVDITPDELYKKVDEKGVLPSTAAVSSAKFQEVFKKWVDQGYDIVYLGIGSGFSSSFQSAYIAAQEFEEGRVFPVDSLNLSTGTGLLVIQAHKMIKEGLSAKEIAAKLKDLVPHVTAQFVVDKLDYLHKGGRCSGASKLFGHLFHIHPVILVENGKMVVHRKSRGPIRVGVLEQADDLRNDLPVDDYMIFVTHSGFDENLIKLAVDEVKKIVPTARVEVTRAGCVVSTHCGPGTLGILYIRK